MSQLNSKHLISINDLSDLDIDLIFRTTESFKDVINRPVVKKVPSLIGMTVSNIFFESSTRTKLSFELAEKRLSADIINFSSSNSSLKKGESFLDTIHNILAMKVDAIVLRHSMSGAPNFLSRHTNAVIINAGDGHREHPTQALSDCFSLKEKFGKLKNLKVLLVGDVLHSRVALSNILLMKRLGIKLKICAPYNLIPKSIEKLGVEVTNNLNKALSQVDVAMFLRMQFERQNEFSYLPSMREYIKEFGLDIEKYEKLKSNLTIMHPGPINKGVELTTEVASLKEAIILSQVENGVALRMALLYLLVQNKDR